jgi:hypothetical protein
VIDPAYKVVALMWGKDLLETVVMIAIAYPLLRRTLKKYLGTLQCPHCGKHFTEPIFPGAPVGGVYQGSSVGIRGLTSPGDALKP